MTKLASQEQARSLEPSPSGSRFQAMKKWILRHKIETTAILVCLLGVIVILCLVYIPTDETSGNPVSPNTETNGSGGDVSSPSDDTNNGNYAPSSTPYPPAPDDLVTNSPIFQKLSLLTDLQDTHSPQYKAADWLIALDFLKLSANAPNLPQRFALATLYLSTGGGLADTDGWTRCSSVPPPSENEANQAASNVQCILKDGKIVCAEKDNFETCAFTDEEGIVIEGKRFLSPVSECEWYGVTCNESGVVIAIDIESNELVGELPSELALLTSLTRLNLSINRIGGTIPKELGLIEGMQDFLLTSNELEGSIPAELYEWSSLSRMEVERNTLDGTLNERIGNWNQLQVLYMNHNAFYGELPTQMGQMVALRKAAVNQNQFSGSIPTELGALQNLVSLKFSQNDLTGTMPSGLCSMYVPISADCLVSSTTGAREVTCSCCNRCCADGDKCQDY